jgi:hypothetical protein
MPDVLIGIVHTWNTQQNCLCSGPSDLQYDPLCEQTTAQRCGGSAVVHKAVIDVITCWSLFNSIPPQSFSICSHGRIKHPTTGIWTNIYSIVITVIHIVVKQLTYMKLYQNKLVQIRVHGTSFWLSTVRKWTQLVVVFLSSGDNTISNKHIIWVSICVYWHSWSLESQVIMNRFILRKDMLLLL